MAKALTVAGVEKTKPGAKRIEIPDDIVRGLYLIVQPTGAKSWAARFRVGGRPQKLTIGPYPLFGLPEARCAARDAIRRAIEGGDPGLEKKQARAEAGRRDDLVRTIVREYIVRYQKPKNRTWAGTARLLGLMPDPANPASKHDPALFIVAPDGPAQEWGSRRIGTITRREIRDHIENLANRAPIGANRTLAALKKMLKWAVQRDIIEANPTSELEMPSPQQHRDRVLSDDELFALWRAAKRLGYPFGHWLKLLILTGQRVDEVGGIRSAELDPGWTMWTIPGPRAKNGKAHLVPLSPQAHAVLDAVPRTKNAKGLFFTTTGRTPISGFSKAKIRIDGLMLRTLRALARKRGEDAGRVTLPNWRFHDVRRTMATRMPALKINMEVVEKTLNHTSGKLGGLVAVYQQYDYADERREALNAWAAYVERLVEKVPLPTVVRMGRRTA
jgi:integrase